MRCKYCRNELDENTNVCPVCGTTNKEKKAEKKPKWIIILCLVLAGLILLTATVGMISYFTTGRLLPLALRKNDIFCKTSYSVSLDELNTTSGNKKFQKNREDVVASVGEYQLTNRMLQVYYWDLVGTNTYSDLDKTKPLDQQYQDPNTEKTWQQFFIEKAIETWKREMIAQDMAKKAGFEMPAEYVEYYEYLKDEIVANAVSNNYTSTDSFVASVYGRGTTFQTNCDYLWNYLYASAYWTEYVNTVEVDMDEIEAYYEANKTKLVIEDFGFQVTKESGKLANIRHILIKPEADILDEKGQPAGISDESWEACRADAQALLDYWLAGDKTEESFAALATEKSEDPGSQYNGGLYADMPEGVMVQTFNDWCFDESRQVGDYGLVKTPYGYHIMYYCGGGEEGWIKLSTEGAQLEKSAEIMNELAEQTPVEVNYKKIVLAELS